MHICILFKNMQELIKSLKLIKINIHERILPIFLINLINILAKTIKYKESLNINKKKTYLSDFAQILRIKGAHSYLFNFFQTFGGFVITRKLLFFS